MKTINNDPIQNERGAALLMAIFTLTVLMVIATEIVYESSVEFVVSAQAVNQVKAHYAAKSGVEISLLRTHIYRKAMAMVGDSLPNKSMLDPVWQMPFTWPIVVPESATLVTKEEVNATVKTSLMSSMKAEFISTIESEGARIDVNDLASPSTIVAEATRQQLLQIFASKTESDEEFSARHRGTDFNKILNNMADWIDADDKGLNGGDESSVYLDRDSSSTLPPNQPFKTVMELHMVEGMNDEFFALLEPRITVFGAKGINPNHASKEVLMSLSPQITAERADQIIEARAAPDRGPFNDEGDFVDFLQTLGVNDNPFRNDKDEPIVPLAFEATYNFRIRSTGQAGPVTKDIVAITYDYDQVKKRLKELVGVQLSPTPTPTPASPGGAAAAPAPNPSPTPKKADSQKPSVPNKRPNIVYWNES